MNLNRLICFLSVCALNGMALAQTAPLQGQLHISSSNAGSNPFNGVNVNSLVGADRFYNAGYDGSRAILGNIEAGHADPGHSVLTHVTNRVTGTGAVGSNDRHATWVTHSMSGRQSGQFGNNYFEPGIAPGATTYSGAIATSFGSGTSFSLSAASTASTYSTMITTGTGLPQTVDVFNSSWGFTSPTGNNLLTGGVDGLINDSGVVGVFSAGNSGPGTNSVGGIGAGYNSITVGALGSDTSNPAYSTISGFSSRSPNDFYNASTGQTISAARAAVDITAPGQNLTLAAIGTSTSYNTNLAGTSFSAPIVAGGAGLVVDAGKDLYGGGSSIDGRVVKSVLLNSADKLAGWSNGLTNNGGVLETTQSLDYTYGAGRMNLDSTFDQFVNIANGGMAGTTDLIGGDTIATVGWDLGTVSAGGIQSYFIDQQLLGGSEFSATLSWFADTNPGSLADFAGAAYEHLANLDLFVFEYDNPTSRNIIRSIARSISLYNVVEHLSFNLDRTGFYGIQVGYTGSHWNFSGETGETYGLSWSGTAVPEPSTTVLLLLGSLVAVRQIRRRRGEAAD
jgi:hypothetical protein